MTPFNVVGFFDVAYAPGSNDEELTAATQANLDELRGMADDVLVVCYGLASGDPLPRLAKGASHDIEAQGDAVVANYLFLDVDRNPHEPWPPGHDVHREISGALDQAYSKSDGIPAALDLLETVSWYATPRGYRLMWRLDPPLPIRKYESLFRRTADILGKAGIKVDTQTCDWTRLSYTPRALGREPLSENYQGLDQGIDAEGVLGVLPEVPDVPARKAQASTDAAPHDAAWEHWAVLPGWLRTGVFPGDTSSERFQAMRATLATVARVLPEEELDDDTVLRAVAGAWQRTEEQGLTGTWGWSDVEGLTAHILDREVGKRATMKTMSDWFRPRRAATTDTPEGPEVSEARPPEDPTEDDLKRLSSVASNAKLRGFLDRLLAEKVPSGETQAAARRDAVRTLAERAFSGRGLYRDLTPMETAESLYRVLGGHIIAVGVDTHDELVDLLQRVGQEAAELHRREARRAEALAAMHEDLPPLLVLGHTGSFYVLDGRADRDRWTYVPAASSVLGQVLRSYSFPGLPAELQVPISGPRGGLRSAAELVDEYKAPVIQEVVYDYAARRARLEGDALVLPTLDRPDLEPQYHAPVDAWLRALAGSDETYDTLVHWLVAAQDLTLPLQCLYLTGSAGTGKSLLQKGLSRLWGGRYADFNGYLLESFQEQMLKTPLFAADDGITVDPRSVHRVSNVFRAVLTDDVRQLNIKYMPKVTLRGHWRLVVSANGDTGIPFTQALGRDALMALAERIFHIEVGDAAREVLEAYRGTDAGEGFITPTGGKLPEHLLYLADVVVLPPVRRRFAVEVPGYATWAEAWSAEQGILPEARTAVAHVLRELRAGRTVAGAYRLDGEDRVLLQLQGARVGWKAASGHRGQPNNNDLRQALEDLSLRATGVSYKNQKYGVQRTVSGGGRQRGYLFPTNYQDVDGE